MATVTEKAPVDKLTSATPVQDGQDNVPRVLIILPLLEEDGSGMKVDQYEHVTINGETTLVKRGEHVNVTVPVYIQLRNRFPNI